MAVYTAIDRKVQGVINAYGVMLIGEESRLIDVSLIKQ